MRSWFTLAFGWPEPTLIDSRKRLDRETAELMRALNQAQELPPSEGGATWHVLKIEVM